jgi:hypothetical protein
MTHIKHYSYKFPKLSEYKVKLFSPLFMLAVILLAITYLHSFKEITTNNFMQVILLPPYLYLSVMILKMTFKIEILIRRIINVCEENSNLSKKGHIYKNTLLVCEDENKKHILEKKMVVSLIIMTLFFILSKRLMIDIYYIKWGLGVFLIIILFVKLRDISHFFYNLANACHQVIIKDNNFTEAFSGKDINWKKFEYKWRKSLAINIILLILTILLFFAFKDFKGTISSGSLFIAASITFKIALDVNTIVKSNIAIMGEYDEYIKNKLGMTICKSEKMKQDALDIVTHVPDVELTFPSLEKIFKKINVSVNKIFRK